MVTGGNDGIGVALARGVGLAGAAVAIWARNDARNEATVAALRAESIEAWSVVCDVAVEADVERAMSATLQWFVGSTACSPTPALPTSPVCRHAPGGLATRPADQPGRQLPDHARRRPAHDRPRERIHCGGVVDGGALRHRAPE